MQQWLPWLSNSRQKWQQRLQLLLQQQWQLRLQELHACLMLQVLLLLLLLLLRWRRLHVRFRMRADDA
jgi:hypothetical protein